MTVEPLSWIKQIQSELSLAKQIPLWGNPPPFPFEKFSELFKEDFSLSHLEIKVKHTEELEPDFLSSFGQNPSISCFEMGPLPGLLYLILSLESLEKMLSLLLAPTTSLKGPVDPNLREGFYQYVLLKAAECLEKTQVYPSLRVQWLEKKSLPNQKSFALDLEIKMQECYFPARLVLSSEFHKAFSSHFVQTMKEDLSSPLVGKIDLSVRMEMGSCLLSQKEWKSVKKGDFIVLDRCSYDPREQKGILTLFLGETPLFKIKLKKNKMKVLDYYTYNGDQTIMEEDMDLNPFEEEPIPELSDEEMDAEEGFEEKSTQESLTLPQDISLPIVVEAGRTQISLQTLLALKPGNILDLPIRPEEGVYLTVHGKKVAKGELLKLGETLGVKVIEIGENTSS